MKPSPAISRRRFIGVLGSTLAAIQVLELGAIVVDAGTTCGYGAGSYGAGPYGGVLPADVPAIGLERSGDDIVLKWPLAPDVRYEVWRSSTAVRPGDIGSQKIGEIQGDSFTDPGAGLGGSDLYYVVRGLPICP